MKIRVALCELAVSQARGAGAATSYHSSASMTKQGVRLLLLATVSLLLVLLHTPESLAFVPSSSVTNQQRRNGLSFAIARLATNTQGRRASRGVPALPTTRLFFFGRDNNSKKEEENEDKVESKPKEEKDEKFSFFGFLNRDRGNQKEATSDAHEDSSSSTSDATTTATTTTTSTAIKDAPPQEQVPSKPPAPVVAQPPESPAQRAAKLRSEAERMRLEAERMDAELTLRKIARLEKELTAAKASGGDSTTATEKKSSSKKDVSELQREIDALLNKVQGGGKTAGSSGAASASASASATASSKLETTSANATATAATTDADIFGSPVIKPVWPEYVEPFDQEAYDKIYSSLKNLPQILLGVAALSVNVRPSPDPETGKTVVNATELSVTLDKLRRLDFSFSNKPPPKFTKAQIAEEAAKLSSSAALKVEKSGTWLGGLENAATDDMELSEIFSEPRLLALRESEPEKFAQLYLEFEYYSDPDVSEKDGDIDGFIAMAGEQPLLNALMGGIVNGTLPTALDNLIDGMYPKCTTKKDAEQPTKQPTEAQVSQLIADILPKANFQASSKPESVSGGYIIRGSTKFETGNEFIAKLDQVMERSSLKDKMTVLYAPDFSSIAEDEDDFNPFEAEAPILYVVAPEICREPRPVQLSIVSGLGLATSWYLSIFPFLLNPAIATRVDEQLALADASMTPDLAFLTDLSLPLFTTFLGIQLVHEMAHLVAAGANNVRVCLGARKFVACNSLLCQVFANSHIVHLLPSRLADQDEYSGICSIDHYWYYQYCDHVQNSSQKQSSHV